MSDPSEIWLEPEDHEMDPDMGRSWCVHPLDCDECGAESVRYVRADIAEARVKELEHDLEMARRHIRDILSERHAIEAALSDERQKARKLEAENAELRAELLCNKMCVRYWPSHHVECCLLSARLKRIQQQADDEGEA